MFLTLLPSFKAAEALWARRTCCSSTATSHTDSVSSSPVIPQSSAAAEEKLDHKPAIVLETFQSSCAVLPLPSKHTNTTATQTASENRDESDKHTGRNLHPSVQRGPPSSPRVFYWRCPSLEMWDDHLWPRKPDLLWHREKRAAQMGINNTKK